MECDYMKILAEYDENKINNQFKVKSIESRFVISNKDVVNQCRTHSPRIFRKIDVLNFTRTNLV